MGAQAKIVFAPHSMDISVVPRRDTLNAWTVEAIDDGSDGEVYQAVFVGPEAEERAREYARFKYGQ